MSDTKFSLFAKRLYPIIGEGTSQENFVLQLLESITSIDGEETVEDIIQTVKCFSNNEISYETVVDENIIGGIIVYIGSVVYDYSIKRQIDLLQSKFTYGN